MKAYTSNIFKYAMLLATPAPVSCDNSQTPRSPNQNGEAITSKPVQEHLPVHTKSGDHNLISLEPKDVERIGDLGPWQELRLVEKAEGLDGWKRFLRVEYCRLPLDKIPSEFRTHFNAAVSSLTLFRINNTKGEVLLWLNLDLDCGSRSIRLELVETKNRSVGVQYKLVDLPDDCELKQAKVLRAAEK